MSSGDKGFKHESIDTLWRRALSNSLVFLSLPTNFHICKNFVFLLLRLSYHTSKCNFKIFYILIQRLLLISYNYFQGWSFREKCGSHPRYVSNNLLKKWPRNLAENLPLSNKVVIKSFKIFKSKNRFNSSHLRHLRK